MSDDAGPPGPASPTRLYDVPLFPLPNVVLLPRAVLPLHVFEPRYREMTADALDGDGRIAMALLAEGWQQHYHGRPAIHPAVCVGRILSHERLPDGRYNLLLQGELRAEVLREDHALSYRRADLAVLTDLSVFDGDLADERRRLAVALANPRLARTTLGRELAKLAASPLPTCELADVCAFSLLEDVRLKQELLADPDARSRVRRTLRALATLFPPTPPGWGKPNLN